MIRILHILGSMNRGGAETFIMNMYRNINRNDIQFDFLLNTNCNDYSDEIEGFGGEIFTMEPRNRGIVKYIKSLNTFFTNHKYEIIHYHTSSLSSIEPLIIAKICGVNCRIIHSHNTNQKGKFHKLLHYINKPFVKFVATDYLGCSDLANKWMFKCTGVYSKSIMINNGINCQGFAYNKEVRENMRDILSVKDDTLLFGHIGRFCEVKNHRFIVKTFYSYLQKYGNAYLVMVGNGELFNEIKEQVSELGIENNVAFLGVRSDIAEILQAIDVLLFPSLYEGLPVALVEAQASGVMIYGSDRISSDMLLSDNIKFISLEKDENYWSEFIRADFQKYQRCDKSKIIEGKGFDIKTTVNYMIRSIYKI